jgi:uncharacterized protein with PhoU and TrkA domain
MEGKIMDPQEYSLTIEEKEGYLYVQAGGTRTRETVSEITMRVFQAAVDQHLSKVLIDVRELIGYFGVKDIYYLVSEVLKDLRGKGVDQIAVIDVRRSPAPVWFLEPIAQSRGFNFRVFAEETSALKWLCA